MVRKSKGFKFRTRSLFKKRPRERGMPPLGSMLTDYEVGETVNIKIEPSIQAGQPHRRFHGRSGVVKEKRGRCYVIKVKIGNMAKFAIVRPEHIHKNQR